MQLSAVQYGMHGQMSDFYAGDLGTNRHRGSCISCLLNHVLHTWQNVTIGGSGVTLCKLLNPDMPQSNKCSTGIASEKAKNEGQVPFFIC